MKHEPSLAILMEVQLGWAHKLGGAESLGISKRDQTVLAKLMESQMWHQLAGCGFVWEGFSKGTMASAGLDTRHFSLSPVYHWCLSRCHPRAGAQRE